MSVARTADIEDAAHADEADPADEPVAGWTRWVIITGAVVAILLLGASAGVVIGARAGGMAVPGAESVDVGFSQDMSVHHRQAVLMAGIARDRTDGVLGTLAFDIDTTQQGQIGWMQGWLSLWDASPTPTGNHMRWMPATGEHAQHGSGSDGVAMMPGMATEAELQRLREASGRAFEVLFLQLMLRHHQGGVPMLEYAAEHAEVPQVRSLASNMLDSQLGEAEYLSGLLADRDAEPLPSPI